MGVDLSLFLGHDSECDPSAPVWRDVWTDRTTYLFEYVNLTRHYELWSKFEDAVKREGGRVKKARVRDDDHGWRDADTDPYGQMLHTIPIREAVTALESMPSAELSPKNRAILAYLRALHPDARVLLWWH